MWGRARHSAVPAQGPVLDLSGPRLRQAFEHLAEAAEPGGGIERYVGALALKSSLFEELLGKGRVSTLGETEFCDLCGFITPVRRRVGAWLGRHGFAAMRQRLERLLMGRADAATADARLAAFTSSFPADREHRWARDLAAEILHFTAPEHYPLMTRWMWDARTNTGVLREIWFANGAMPDRIAVADGYATFLALREELSGYLAQQGFFRDLPHYVDLLCAQVYAEYICDQGGSYLRVDFSVEPDPLAFTRRLLGLDGIRAGSGRARLNTIDARPAAG